MSEPNCVKLSEAKTAVSYSNYNRDDDCYYVVNNYPPRKSIVSASIPIPNSAPSSIFPLHSLGLLFAGMAIGAIIVRRFK